MSLRKNSLLGAKFSITAIILYFLWLQVSKYWADVADYNWTIDWLLLLASISIIQIGPILFAQSWRLLIVSFGYPLAFKHAFKITYMSNLGRYLPGKIWQFVGVMYLTKKKGIPPEPAGASFILVQFFAIPAAFLVYAISAQLEPTIGIDQVALMGPYSAILMTSGMLLFSALLIFYPQPFVLLANRLLLLLKRPAMTFELDKTVALKVMGGYFLAWIVYGLAFWLFLMSVNANEAPGPIAAVGIFALSYQIGYLFLLAPGGFGPRELVMSALLIPYFGPVAPMIAILARLWSLAMDSLAALVAIKIKL